MVHRGELGVGAPFLEELSPAIVAYGFVDCPVPLRSIDGATVGLSLLRDLLSYRHSLSTKVLEYLAHVIPVITTPLPGAQSIVEDSGGEIVVPFDAPVAVAEAVVRMASGSFRRECGENGDGRSATGTPGLGMPPG